MRKRIIGGAVGVILAAGLGVGYHERAEAQASAERVKLERELKQQHEGQNRFTTDPISKVTCVRVEARRYRCNLVSGNPWRGGGVGVHVLVGDDGRWVELGRTELRGATATPGWGSAALEDDLA